MKFVYDGFGLTASSDNKLYFLDTDNCYYLYENGKGNEKRRAVKKIRKSVYLQAKYGPAWKEMNEWLQEKNMNEPTSFFRIKEHLIVVEYMESTFFVFDQTGKLIRSHEADMNDCEIYDACTDGKSIWTVHPLGDAVRRFSYPEFRPVQTWAKNHGFAMPEGVNMVNGAVTVADTENHHLVSFQGGKWETIETFKEKVWEVIEIDTSVFVRLDSGIYELDSIH